MTLNSRWSPPWLAKAVRSLNRGIAGAALLVGAGSLTAGCLKRPVTPATPQTTNVYINQIRQTGVDKIDLLFMIDNSISMADKQEILSDAVPVLVQRLITPACVDEMGTPVGANASKQTPCPKGSAPEFKAIENIHIGVITSSLGDHGSNDVCSDAQNAINVSMGGTASTYNDLAQLMPSVRAADMLHSWNNKGFLVWDPRDQKNVLPQDRHDPLSNHETNPTDFVADFKAHVTSAREHGCGYESSLEAWYRFLIDPEPVSTLTHTSDDSAATVRPKDGSSPPKTVINQTVLQQRAAFLRPDSLLAIIQLSDENDCSIVDEDGTQGWLVSYKGGTEPNAQLWHMPRGNSACAANPNDKNCRPCTPSDTSDPECTKGLTLTLNEDSMNMRCFNQQRRFGINLLYDTGRYVEGLASKTVRPRFGGPEVPNPIYGTGTPGEVPRDSGLVFFAGIVGVPWQDIATEDSIKSPNQLTYLSATEIQTAGRWDLMLGNGGPPTDPMMIESIDPRPIGAMHPLVPNAAIAPDTATNNPNVINGHEQTALGIRDDLQFACIFKRGTPLMCTDANQDGCDCNSDEAPRNSPLCQGATATANGTQVYAKAYPGTRHLQVLKDFGKNAIVASICPKNPTTNGDKATDPNYGYNPAVAAIVDRLKEALTVKCLPRPLTPGRACMEGETGADCVEDKDVGKVPCAVVEVRPIPEDRDCTALCSQPGRVALEGERAKIVPAAKEYLKNTGYCEGGACNDYCFCELNQFTNMQDVNGNGGDLDECKTAGTDPALFGYCYVDPAAEEAAGAPQNIIDGENSLVKDCKSSEKRILRFLGEGVPAKDGLAFIACIGAAAAD
ncbi:MAG TPA: hypothetical protein VNN72_04130 [Polyangiaceae bacterium]|nr:hypothetical protein [Polyangiaceae bacterium]